MNTQARPTAGLLSFQDENPLQKKLNARLPVRIFVTLQCLDGGNTDQREMNEGGSVPLKKPPPSGASADTRLKLIPGHGAGFFSFVPPLFIGIARQSLWHPPPGRDHQRNHGLALLAEGTGTAGSS